MKSKKKLMGMLILSFLLADVSSFAQKPLTLKECIKYSLSNNSNIKIADYNVIVSQKQIDEQIGSYLPQINASGSLDDNLKLSTQLLPAEMMGGTPGTFVPIKFGNKYSMSGGVQLTQKLYDPASLLMIKTAKINKDISVLSQQQTNELTAYNISLIYYQTLVIQMQANVLKSTLTASEQSLKSIELKYKNGMAKKIDVDKIRVSYNNTKSQLEQSELSYSQSLNTLKYNMGMPVDSSMALADTTIIISKYLLENDTVQKLQMENIIDYQLKKTNISLMQIDKKTKIATFLPALSFYGNYNYNAMRQEFNFFDANKDWYPSSGIGLKLTIPIFDGLQRNSKVAQSELNIKIAKENLLLSEQSIKVDISNYEIQYKNALDNINSEKENLDLAESVYKNTQLEYQQGVGSTLDLIQSESSYMVAQNTYFNKLLNLYIARLELEKAKGSLMNFINNLK
ncbi:MAG: TolC family protein [Bacteroidetes bacterium]|nr:TolC family protein [Bacteroidota bacterium]